MQTAMYQAVQFFAKALKPTLEFGVLAYQVVPVFVMYKVTCWCHEVHERHRWLITKQGRGDSMVAEDEEPTAFVGNVKIEPIQSSRAAMCHPRETENPRSSGFSREEKREIMGESSEAGVGMIEVLALRLK